jgi:hypothetical protein
MKNEPEPDRIKEIGGVNTVNNPFFPLQTLFSEDVHKMV